MDIAARASSGLGYQLAALVLVACYVAAFGAWQVLAAGLGPGGAAIVPVALTALACLAAVALGLRRAGTRTVRPLALAAGVAVALGALVLSDPAFPAKRIHVAEYAVLALVVGRALGPYLGGRALLAATALATAVLGSHDELIQGLVAVRSFGLRDFAVDAVAGIAGVAIGHGLGLFPADAGAGPARLGAAEWLALALLAVGWLGLLAAMPGLSDAPMPLWPVLPLAGAGLAWAIAAGSGDGAAGARRALAVVGSLMLATGAYPVLAHALALAFH